MGASITFFPVDNGDMTLVQLADSDNTSILVDLNIRAAADDPDDSTRDVAKDLRDGLKTDANGRPYVDVLLNSHPDKDHITGYEKHFYSGPLADYPDDDKPLKERRIVVREMWCSLTVYKRACKSHTLGDDAKAFNKESRRRIDASRKKDCKDVPEGDRVVVFGEDDESKDLGDLLIEVDTTFSKVNGKDLSKYFKATMLGPLTADNDKDDELLGKNNSSVILNMSIGANASAPDACRFLTAGDAEVAIWERLWGKHKDETEPLEYDILQTPHHCSWRSMSNESWGDARKAGKKAAVNKDARSALSQARDGAFIVATCKEIKDDNDDPPCYGAKQEYEAIAKGVEGSFICTAEYPEKASPAPLKLDISPEGPTLPPKKASDVKTAGMSSAARTPQPHG
jgi:hypothetical protein